MQEKLPLVSICTPTFNRRPFIPYLIKCIENQDYPKDKIEWIIIDDGTDKIEDIILISMKIKITYKYFEKKMTLGKKRNIMHEYCRGDIIIYFDDDDYYPPERISHAVNMLLNNPKYLIAGSDIMYLYFREYNKLYKCGPYGENRATAATFAFKKELLDEIKYNDEDVLSEERLFLKNYTIPLLKLDPLKTILVVSHIHNSIDKKLLLKQLPNKHMCEENKINPESFFNNVMEEIKYFYLYQLDMVLIKYEMGEIKNKPDMLEEIEKKMENRYKMILVQKNNEIIKYREQIMGKERLIQELFKKIR
uniref:Glycosyltransferase 2-like domain-containing protein n=1 Tax=viral metagenome TaxID=1070528 RepID=A0A6C0H505_9ZZZZ